MHSESTAGRTATHLSLWIVQGLLALLFLFAGGVKLLMPLEELTQQLPLPGAFVRFIGVVEVLGALGLILPGLTHMRTGLTPLAAAGLTLVMLGATLVTLLLGYSIASAMLPLGLGMLAALVVWGRTRVSP